MDVLIGWSVLLQYNYRGGRGLRFGLYRGFTRLYPCIFMGLSSGLAWFCAIFSDCGGRFQREDDAVPETMVGRSYRNVAILGSGSD